MANDKARKTAEEALTRLSSELEAGKSETLKTYLAAMGRFHRYSWGKRSSDQLPAPLGDPCRRIPHLARSRACRQAGREGHHDSCSDHP